MDSLKINCFNRTFKNPVIAASGTYGYGFDYERYYSPAKLGGIALKGLTVEPRPGNEGIRLWETPAGLLNSIGLENPGLDAFRRDYLEEIKQLDTQILVNVAGHSMQDYATVLEGLRDVPEFLIELNLSCPNVKDGMAFGMNPKEAANLVRYLKERFGRELIVKLTPNAPSITEVAQAVQEAGADGISLINTINGLAVDYKRKAYVFENITAGLSGPAVKPIALKMVRDVVQAVDIPVIGIGGIVRYSDVLEFLMVGASLVEIGTANFINPKQLDNIIDDLESYCKFNKERLSELVGIL